MSRAFCPRCGVVIDRRTGRCACHRPILASHLRRRGRRLLLALLIALAVGGLLVGLFLLMANLSR